MEGKKIKFSIIIPAHNEEKYIGKCLDSIMAAAAPYKNQVETIVVLNRCTDRTEEIAKSYNCITLKNEDKNLSKIRNAGAKIAKGDILITIDADTCMNKTLLAVIDHVLSTGLCIGGGVTGVFDRMSLGMAASLTFLTIPIILKYGWISVGIFWCYRKDFEAINGFNEDILMLEDCDFAKRLFVWGLKNKKFFGTIPFAMTTSSRKFDKYGDWMFIKRPELICAYLKETDRKHADELYYEYENERLELKH
ncbi:glycosyltransferase [Metabacillus sp. KIGAM252]|uniref:4,4'-diaponeurosporenoate glycosyltransferase n=2 Tax=Metabacillus flavus TaxID=2823519 RepID=A0ABS5LA33_9BACI|nr:glycosyltransferase [Metabacillus flavus]MBS2967491.1 glycosyltransferase [Metabacillus flavus]